MNNFLAKLKEFDLPLLITSLLLVFFGLSVLYATSLVNPSLSIFWRQTLYAAVGLVIMLGFSFANYHGIIKYNRFLYAFMLVSLVTVLLFRDIRGSSRWIDIGPLSYQPSEIAKLIIILVLARWFQLRSGLVNSIKYISTTIVLVIIPFCLVLIQPDLGSALVLGFIWLGCFFFSPVNKKLVGTLLITVAIVGGVAWQFVLADYQKARLEIFLQPERDPKGKGYNVRQAIIAVGSGQWLGQGLGKGLQSGLKFLPERQTDFVFAAAAEETGLVGSITIIGLYSFLLYRIIRIMQLAGDNLGRFLAVAIFSYFFGQVVINIGMNIGIAPVTGIPLPFFSYGGNSMLVSLALIGILQSVVIHSKSRNSVV